ncbi:hypothetical protein Tco_0299409, partial [Tanacetum coccineum]
VISKAFQERSRVRVFQSLHHESLHHESEYSRTAEYLREGFPFQSVTVLSNEGSSIPEQLNVDRMEFADAVNALTKICSSHLVGSGAGIFSSAIDGKVRSKCENNGIVPTEMELVLEYTQQGASHEVSDHLKMEMEMEIPSSSNVKLITECSDTTYTCYEVMKDLIKVSKLPQTLISYSSSQKNTFKTYVKSKDIDLWHIIIDGDYKPIVRNMETGKDETIPYEKLKDDNKKMFSKNDEAKMVLYKAMPKKEYERIFMCKKAKDIWNSLVITHQVLEKDSEVSKNKKEKYKSLSLKAKKVSSDEEASCSDSEDEEYPMAVKDFKKFFRRREKFIRQPHDDKKAFRREKEEKKGKVDRCWRDNEEEDDPKKDDICLMEHDSNEDKKALGFTEHKTLTSGVKTGKISKNSATKVTVDLAQPEPSEREPTSTNEGYRATIAAEAYLKPILQNRNGVVHITKKTSPRATIGNTKQPPALKLGQGLAKKMEPDIENMTMNECLEYEAVKERQLWDDVRSKRSPTNYNEADVDSFHQNKTPATKSILDELLEEFGDEILNVTMVDDEVDFNPTKDLEELERLLTQEPQSNFTKIQMHSVIINTKPFIHTQLMNPLYGMFKTSKPCKVDRDIISPGRYAFYSSFTYPVAYLHPKGVYCYFHPHLIPSEGMDTRLPSK